MFNVGNRVRVLDRATYHKNESGTVSKIIYMTDGSICTVVVRIDDKDKGFTVRELETIAN